MECVTVNCHKNKEIGFFPQVLAHQTSCFIQPGRSLMTTSMATWTLIQTPSPRPKTPGVTECRWVMFGFFSEIQSSNMEILRSSGYKCSRFFLPPSTTPQMDHLFNLATSSAGDFWRVLLSILGKKKKKTSKVYQSVGWLGFSFWSTDQLHWAVPRSKRLDTRSSSWCMSKKGLLIMKTDSQGPPLVRWWLMDWMGHLLNMFAPILGDLPWEALGHRKNMKKSAAYVPQETPKIGCRFGIQEGAGWRLTEDTEHGTLMIQRLLVIWCII